MTGKGSHGPDLSGNVVVVRADYMGELTPLFKMGITSQSAEPAYSIIVLVEYIPLTNQNIVAIVTY